MQDGEYEYNGGVCPACGERAVLRTCSVCGEQRWTIDCGHYSQPRPIAAGRANGSELHNDFCEDCAQEVA